MEQYFCFAYIKQVSKHWESLHSQRFDFSNSPDANISCSKVRIKVEEIWQILLYNYQITYSTFFFTHNDTVNFR